MSTLSLADAENLSRAREYMKEITADVRAWQQQGRAEDGESLLLVGDSDALRGLVPVLDKLIDLSCPPPPARTTTAVTASEAVRQLFLDAYHSAALQFVLRAIVTRSASAPLHSDVLLRLRRLFARSSAPLNAALVLVQEISAPPGDAGERYVGAELITGLLDELLRHVGNARACIDAANKLHNHEQQKAAAALLSVPDRVANATRGAELPALAAPTYFAVLARASLLSWSGSVDHRLSDEDGRASLKAASTRQAAVLISQRLCAGAERSRESVLVWLRQLRSSSSQPLPNDLASLLALSPPSATEDVLRSLAKAPPEVSAARDEVLRLLLSQSDTAQQLAGSVMPSKGALLGGVALLCLVAATWRAASSELRLAHLKAIVLRWQRPHKDHGVDAQISRALLLWLRAFASVGDDSDDAARARDALGGLFADVAAGVSARLESADRSTRLLGMLVGEAFSAATTSQGEECLTFERGQVELDEEERQLEEIAGGRCVEAEAAFSVSEEVARSSSDEDEEESEHVPEHCHAEDADEEAASTASTEDSLEAYAMESDDDDDRHNENALRSLVHATASLTRILALLRKFNQGDEDLAFNSAAVLSALEKVTDGAKRGAPGAAEYAPQLALTIVNLQPSRMPPDEEVVAKDKQLSALKALIELSPGAVGHALIKSVVYSNGAVLTARMMALHILCHGARRTCGRFPEKGEDDDETPQEDARGEQKITLGKVVWRSERTLKAQRGVRPINNRFAPVAERLFRALAYAWTRGGAIGEHQGVGIYLDLTGRDSTLGAQMLATLSVFVSCAGPQCLKRGDLAPDLIQIALHLKDLEVAAIRRSAALAIGSAAEAMSAEQLMDVHLRLALSGTDALEWLSRAKEHDPDSATRRFAASSSARWAAKLAAHVPYLDSPPLSAFSS